jgi:hypothetical protein
MWYLNSGKDVFKPLLHQPKEGNYGNGIKRELRITWVLNFPFLDFELSCVKKAKLSTFGKIYWMRFRE